MYRRYSQRNGDGLSLTQMKRNRIKDIVILLLIAAVIAMAVFLVPALREKSEERETYIHRFQVEAEEASRLTTSLSRTAGADSAAILAKIRSNIYAIKKLNEHYRNQQGVPPRGEGRAPDRGRAVAVAQGACVLGGASEGRGWGRGC